MLGVFTKILNHIKANGLLEGQSFYISFLTDHPGVILSNKVKKEYPKEITIILEDRYKNLQVTKNYFSVDLSFGGVFETVVIPFTALTSFTDTLVNFTFHFLSDVDSFDFEDVYDDFLDNDYTIIPSFQGSKFEMDSFPSIELPNSLKEKKDGKNILKKKGKKDSDKSEGIGACEVISIADFRKKRK